MVLGDITVAPSDVVRSLGALFDAHFSMEAQVSSVIRSCNFHLHQLGKIRKNITASACHTAVQALIISRLDYCNVLLAGVPGYFVQKLQRIQNKAARLIVRAHKIVPTTPIMRDLHWLPMAQRIRFKVLMYAFQAVHNIAPNYVNALLEVRTPTRTLRSSTGPPKLKPPRTGKRLRESSFSRIAPSLWNALPAELRGLTSKNAFKRQLKTYLFKTHYHLVTKL